MACRRASFASARLFRSSASMRLFAAVVPAASSTLHSGQRLAKPGLSGLSSNSSEHTAHILIGSGIALTFYDFRTAAESRSIAWDDGQRAARLEANLQLRTHTEDDA